MHVPNKIEWLLTGQNACPEIQARVEAGDELSWQSFVMYAEISCGSGVLLLYQKFGVLRKIQPTRQQREL